MTPVQPVLPPGLQQAGRVERAGEVGELDLRGQVVRAAVSHPHVEVGVERAVPDVDPVEVRDAGVDDALQPVELLAELDHVALLGLVLDVGQAGVLHPHELRRRAREPALAEEAVADGPRHLAGRVEVERAVDAGRRRIGAVDAGQRRPRRLPAVLPGRWALKCNALFTTWFGGNSSSLKNNENFDGTRTAWQNRRH